MNFASMVARLRTLRLDDVALGAAIAVLVTLCANPAAQAASIQPLEIATKSGVQVFSVEMATTEEEKTNRADVPQGTGRR